MYDFIHYLNQYPVGELWNFPLLFAALVLPFLIKGDQRAFQADFSMVQPSFTSPVKRELLFSAFLVFYLAYGSPLQVLSNQLFTAKIIQQVLLFFIVPPLLLLGLPQRWLGILRWNYRVKTTFRIITNPFLSLVVFQGVYAIYFIPSLFNELALHPFGDFFAQAVLFLLSLWTWWPIFSNQSDLNKLRELPKLFYVFCLNVIFIMAVSPYLFVKQALFAMPLKEKTNFMLAPLTDIQVGIAAMLILHEVILAFVLAWIILSWFKREDKIDPRDVSGQMGLRILERGKMAKKARRT